ncbi:hypothetical protein Zmor_020811 [Zophobas morio]|uniref:B box-type domain-containing protein n=1 Tax=Zophobas morio TaxID=2755281 RepID=A0AA38I884_9CUCU|nr:hypothetical protein Zmor_020811 [Zophobas morio]
MSCNRNTTSSCSSTSNDMDSLVCNIISVALQDMCGNCDEGSTATSRCTDCTELLCGPCVRAHQRVRLTKDHRISALPSNIVTSPITVDSEISSPEANVSPCSMTSTLCDTHKWPARLFCGTCVALICSDCILTDHAKHEITYLQEKHTPISVHSRLNLETKSAIHAVEDAMKRVNFMSTKIHEKLQKTSCEVQSVFKRYINVLERRAQELMKRIDQIQRYKAFRLLTQMERLRTAHSRLKCLSELLSSSIGGTSNENEFVAVNEKVHNELKVLRSVQSELFPCETDSVSFSVEENGLLSVLSTFGELSSMPWPPVASTSQASTPPFDIFDMNQHCRPVYGVSDQIVVTRINYGPPKMFSREGVQNGELCRPWGVCCNSLGHIIVADRSNNRIQVFDSTGVFMYKFGRQGNGIGEFERPAGICVSPLNHIVVADKDNHRIQLFKMDGTFVLTFGEKGSQNGQFNYPWDVSCNTHGDIVVSDTRNHRVQLFTSTGAFVTKFGFDNNPMWKYFDSPRGVCFTPSGNIMITDFNNHRILVIDRNLTHPQFLGEEGSRHRQFLRPQGIACDDQGNIIVADSKNHRIQVMDSCGNFLFLLGRPGKKEGEFDRPSGLCLGPTGKIIVVDFGNTRIQVF